MKPAKELLDEWGWPQTDPGYDEVCALIQTVQADAQGEIDDFKNGVQTFKCPNCKQSGIPFYQVNLQQEIKELQAERDAYRDALEKLSKHSGWCEGPLGCGCKAPIAREVLARFEKRE